MTTTEIWYVVAQTFTYCVLLLIPCYYSARRNLLLQLMTGKEENC